MVIEETKYQGPVMPVFVDFTNQVYVGSHIPGRTIYMGRVIKYRFHWLFLFPQGAASDNQIILN